MDAADNAGAWGKITVDSTGTQFQISCKLVIGDGTNTITFSDLNKQIIIPNGVASYNDEAIWIVANNAVLELGQVNDPSKKTTSNGCTILYLDTINQALISTYTDGLLKFYSTSVASTNKAFSVYYTQNCIFWNCQFQQPKFWGGCDIYHLKSEGSPHNGGTMVGSNTIDGYSVTDAVAVGLYLSYSTTAKGVFIRNSNAYGSFVCNAVPTHGTHYLINPDVDVWKFQFEQNNTVYRQYEFDLSVLNGEITDFVENANVTLVKGTTKIGSWLTNSSGQIDTQVLTYGYYDQAHGDSIQDASTPFTLTVTHSDWANYTSRFYVTEKTHMTISMQEKGETMLPVGQSEESLVWMAICLLIGGGASFMVIKFIRRT